MVENVNQIKKEE